MQTEWILFFSIYFYSFVVSDSISFAIFFFLFISQSGKSCISKVLNVLIFMQNYLNNNIFNIQLWQRSLNFLRAFLHRNDIFPPILFSSWQYLYILKKIPSKDIVKSCSWWNISKSSLKCFLSIHVYCIRLCSKRRNL